MGAEIGKMGAKNKDEDRSGIFFNSVLTLLHIG